MAGVGEPSSEQPSANRFEPAWIFLVSVGELFEPVEPVKPAKPVGIRPVLGDQAG